MEISNSFKNAERDYVDTHHDSNGSRKTLSGNTPEYPLTNLSVEDLWGGAASDVLRLTPFILDSSNPHLLSQVSMLGDSDFSLKKIGSDFSNCSSSVALDRRISKKYLRERRPPIADNRSELLSCENDSAFLTRTEHCDLIVPQVSSSVTKIPLKGDCVFIESTLQEIIKKNQTPLLLGPPECGGTLLSTNCKHSPVDYVSTKDSSKSSMTKNDRLSVVSEGVSQAKNKAKGVSQAEGVTQVEGVSQSDDVCSSKVGKISLSFKRAESTGTWYVPTNITQSKRRKNKRKEHLASSTSIDVSPERIRNIGLPAYSLPILSRHEIPNSTRQEVPVQKSISVKSPTVSQIMCISKIKASIAEFKTKIRIATMKSKGILGAQESCKSEASRLEPVAKVSDVCTDARSSIQSQSSVDTGLCTKIAMPPYTEARVSARQIKCELDIRSHARAEVPCVQKVEDNSDVGANRKPETKETKAISVVHKMNVLRKKCRMDGVPSDKSMVQMDDQKTSVLDNKWHNLSNDVGEAVEDKRLVRSLVKNCQQSPRTIVSDEKYSVDVTSLATSQFMTPYLYNNYVKLEDMSKVQWAGVSQTKIKDRSSFVPSLGTTAEFLRDNSFNCSTKFVSFEPGSRIGKLKKPNMDKLRSSFMTTDFDQSNSMCQSFAKENESEVQNLAVVLTKDLIPAVVLTQDLTPLVMLTEDHAHSAGLTEYLEPSVVLSEDLRPALVPVEDVTPPVGLTEDLTSSIELSENILPTEDLAPPVEVLDPLKNLGPSVVDTKYLTRTFDLAPTEVYTEDLTITQDITPPVMLTEYLEHSLVQADELASSVVLYGELKPDLASSVVQTDEELTRSIVQKGEQLHSLLKTFKIASLIPSTDVLSESSVDPLVVDPQVVHANESSISSVEVNESTSSIVHFQTLARSSELVNNQAESVYTADIEVDPFVFRVREPTPSVVNGLAAAIVQPVVTSPLFQQCDEDDSAALVLNTEDLCSPEMSVNVQPAPPIGPIDEYKYLAVQNTEVVASSTVQASYLAPSVVKTDPSAELETRHEIKILPLLTATNVLEPSVVQAHELPDALVVRDMTPEKLMIDTLDVSVESILPLLTESICKTLEEFDAPFDPSLISESCCITECFPEASFLESASLNFPSLPEPLALNDSCAQLDLSLLNDTLMLAQGHSLPESLLFPESGSVNSTTSLSESISLAETYLELQSCLLPESAPIPESCILPDSISIPEYSLYLSKVGSLPVSSSLSLSGPFPQSSYLSEPMTLLDSCVLPEFGSLSDSGPLLESCLSSESLAWLECCLINQTVQSSSFPESTSFPDLSLADALSLLESCSLSESGALSEPLSGSESLSLPESWSLLESCLLQESLSLPELFSMNESLSYPHFVAPPSKPHSINSLGSNLSFDSTALGMTRSVSLPEPLNILSDELLLSKLTSSSTSFLPNTPSTLKLPTIQSKVEPKPALKRTIPSNVVVNNMSSNNSCSQNCSVQSDQNLGKMTTRKNTRSYSELMKNKSVISSSNDPVSSNSSIQSAVERETAPVLMKVRARTTRKAKLSADVCIPTLTAEIKRSTQFEKDQSHTLQRVEESLALPKEISNDKTCCNGRSVTSKNLNSLSHPLIKDIPVLEVMKKSGKRRLTENARTLSDTKKSKQSLECITLNQSLSNHRPVLECYPTMPKKSEKEKTPENGQLNGQPRLNIKNPKLVQKSKSKDSSNDPVVDIISRKLTSDVESTRLLKDQMPQPSMFDTRPIVSEPLFIDVHHFENEKNPLLNASSMMKTKSMRTKLSRKIEALSKPHGSLYSDTDQSKCATAVLSFPTINLRNSSNSSEMPEVQISEGSTQLAITNLLPASVPVLTSQQDVPRASHASISKRKSLIVSPFWEKSRPLINRCKKPVLIKTETERFSINSKREKHKLLRNTNANCNGKSDVDIADVLHFQTLGPHVSPISDTCCKSSFLDCSDIRRSYDNAPHDIKNINLSVSGCDTKSLIKHSQRDFKESILEFDDRFETTKLLIKNSQPDFKESILVLDDRFEMKPLIDFLEVDIGQIKDSKGRFCKHSKSIASSMCDEKERQLVHESIDRGDKRICLNNTLYKDSLSNHSLHTKTRELFEKDVGIISSDSHKFEEIEVVEIPAGRSDVRNVTTISGTLSEKKHKPKSLSKKCIKITGVQNIADLSSSSSLHYINAGHQDEKIRTKIPRTNKLANNGIEDKRQNFESSETVDVKSDSLLIVHKHCAVDSDANNECTQDNGSSACEIIDFEEVTSESLRVLSTSCAAALTEKKVRVVGGYLDAFAKFLQGSEPLEALDTLEASNTDISKTSSHNLVVSKKSRRAVSKRNTFIKIDSHGECSFGNACSNLSVPGPVPELVIDSQQSSSGTAARKNARQFSRIFRRSTLVRQMNKSVRCDVDEVSRESWGDESTAMISDTLNVSSAQERDDMKLKYDDNQTNAPDTAVKIEKVEKNLLHVTIKEHDQSSRSNVTTRLEADRRFISSDAAESEADEVGLSYVRIEIDESQGSVSIFTSERETGQTRFETEIHANQRSRRPSIAASQENQLNLVGVSATVDQASFSTNKITIRSIAEQEKNNASHIISQKDIVLDPAPGQKLCRSNAAINGRCTKPTLHLKLTPRGANQIDREDYTAAVTKNRCINNASINNATGIFNQSVTTKRRSRQRLRTCSLADTDRPIAIKEESILQDSKAFIKDWSKSTSFSEGKDRKQSLPHGTAKQNYVIQETAGRLNTALNINAEKRYSDTRRSNFETDKFLTNITRQSKLSNITLEENQSNIVQMKQDQNVNALDVDDYACCQPGAIKNTKADQGLASIQPGRRRVVSVKNGIKCRQTSSNERNAAAEMSFVRVQLELSTLKKNMRTLFDVLFPNVVADQEPGGSIQRTVPRLSTVDSMLAGVEQMIDVIHARLMSESATSNDYKGSQLTPMHLKCSSEAAIKSTAPCNGRKSSSSRVVLLCNHPARCLARLKHKITAVLALALPHFTLNVKDLCRENSIDELLRHIVSASSESLPTTETTNKLKSIPNTEDVYNPERTSCCMVLPTYKALMVTPNTEGICNPEPASSSVALSISKALNTRPNTEDMYNSEPTTSRMVLFSSKAVTTTPNTETIFNPEPTVTSMALPTSKPVPSVRRNVKTTFPTKTTSDVQAAQESKPSKRLKAKSNISFTLSTESKQRLDALPRCESSSEVPVHRFESTDCLNGMLNRIDTQSSSDVTMMSLNVTSVSPGVKVIPGTDRTTPA